MSDSTPNASNSRQPAAEDPPREVGYKEFRARLDKRDQLLAHPDAQQRHQTVMLVKKVELSPGERAAMGARSRLKTWVALAVTVLIVAGTAALIYSPWLSPAPLKRPPPPPDPVLIPPNERPIEPIRPLPPAPPPAFPPWIVQFHGEAAAVLDLKPLLRTAGEWLPTAQGLLGAPQPQQQVTWLQREFRGDLAAEFEIVVEALPGRPDENAREFRIVFGDGQADRYGAHFVAPGATGKNYATVYDDLGRETSSYGHNRYGWPFETDRVYKLKVVRLGELLTFSRDGEVICSVPQPVAEFRHIGLIPVTGARVRSIRVEAR